MGTRTLQHHYPCANSPGNFNLGITCNQFLSDYNMIESICGNRNWILRSGECPFNKGVAHLPLGLVYVPPEGVNVWWKFLMLHLVYICPIWLSIFLQIDGWIVLQVNPERSATEAISNWGGGKSCFHPWLFLPSGSHIEPQPLSSMNFFHSYVYPQQQQGERGVPVPVCAVLVLKLCAAAPLGF